MAGMSPSQIIVLATPVFFALIAIEFVVGLRRGRNTYRFDDALKSISLGMLSQASVVFVPLLKIGIYTAVFSSLALVPDTGFWTTLPGWLLALLFYDFLYYWNHRLGHTVGVFWAAHVVPPQSQTTTSPPPSDSPAATRCSAGCSTCRWRWPVCRRWCSPWSRSSTCSTSSGSTPSRSAVWAASTAGSPRRPTTACTTR